MSRVRLVVALGSVCAVSVVLAAAARQSAAPQTPAFRAKVDIVSLDVSVYDKDRRPITGLTDVDFTVLEDEKPRPIQGFSEVNIPDPPVPTAAWMRDASTDVATNDVRDRRLVLIVLDDASWGKGDCGLFFAMAEPPMPRCSHKTTALQINDRAKEVAREVIGRLTAVDLAAVVFTGNNRQAQEFTSDHARLIAAIDHVEPTLMHSSISDNTAVETLRSAADMLIGVPGRRKAFIDITRFNPAWDSQGRIGMQTKKIFEAAQRANVNVNIVSLLNERFDATDWEAEWNMRLPKETAGQWVSAAPTVSMADVSAGVARIFQANSSYYMVGYSSANLKNFHTVKVTVDRPGAEVVARDKYYWPEPVKADTADPPPLVKSISGILPDPSLPLRVAVAPFASSSKGNATLVMALGVTPSPDNPRPRGADDLAVRTAIFTPDGRARGLSTTDVRVPLPPGSSAERGYDALMTVDLKPGRYELRLSAHSQMQDANGSVYVTVDVPDFSGAAVSMSGVVFSASPGVPSMPRDLLAPILPVVPTTLRQFKRGEHASAFVRVYQGGSSPPRDLPIHMVIVDAHDQHVVDRTETLHSAAFVNSRGADFRLELPLTSLDAGEYFLTFDAAIGKTSAHRGVQFGVR